jgi:hypothetical protein
MKVTGASRPQIAAARSGTRRVSQTRSSSEHQRVGAFGGVVDDGVDDHLRGIPDAASNAPRLARGMTIFIATLTIALATIVIVLARRNRRRR